LALPPNAGYTGWLTRLPCCFTMEPAASSPKLAGDASDIGGYRILRTLIPDQSWLGVASGGRQVVLKTLDEDCLWQGQLHPNIKDRLARVRELAHAGVANLHGVERDGSLTYLVWEFTEGQTLGERAAQPSCGQRDFLLLARELVLGVEMMHARGIVHGTLKPSNVIIDRENQVVITHVSPLLYSEPSDDVQAVVALLTELQEQRGGGGLDSPLGHLLAQASDGGMSLRRLATRLGAMIESREPEMRAPSDGAAARAIRQRAVMGAGATALIALAIFLGLKQYANARTPKPPTPPQAAPAALKAAPPPAGADGGESPSASARAPLSRRAAP
jgi:serine/threonine protein kinase